MPDNWQDIPAFPCEAQGNRNVPPEHDYIQTGIYSAKFPGMSLRDWFAGQALVGVIMDQASWGVDHSKGAPDFARIAFDIGDAMMAERRHRQPLPSPPTDKEPVG